MLVAASRSDGDRKPQVKARLAEALELVRRGNALGDHFPIIVSFTGVRHAILLLHADRLDESETWCARIEEMATARREGLSLLWIAHVRGLRALRNGDLDAARSAYAQAEEITLRMGIGEPCAVPWARTR
jgi:hypothetical protein